MGRGVVQIMGYVDLWLASFLAAGAVSSLTYALVLYLLPISVFGMSVAAAELPDLSKVEVHDPETRRRFRLRLEDGHGPHRLCYVAPTATLFIVVGDVIVPACCSSGASFTPPTPWRSGYVAPPSRWACRPRRRRGCCRTASTPSTTPAPPPGWP